MLHLIPMLCLGAFFGDAPPSKTVSAMPQLTLSASTEQPYVGEEVRFDLDIYLPATLPPGPPPHLGIPWLAADFGWTVPADEWLCEQSQTVEGVAFAVNDWPSPIRVQAIRDNASPNPTAGQHFRLTWKLITPPPSPLTRGQLKFLPVKLTLADASTQSNALQLTARKLPVPLRDLPRLNLGVGVYQMDDQIDPPELELGAMATLTLRIRGAGPLAMVRRPPLSLLAEVLPTKDFILELGPETWSEDLQTRNFLYTVRPRREGQMSLPGIPYTFFNPRRGDYVTRSTAPLGLRVLPPPAVPTQPVSPLPTTIPDRLRVELTPADLHYEEPSWPSRLVLWTLLGVPPLLWGGLLLGKWRTVAASWRRRDLSRTRAAALALHELRDLDHRRAPASERQLSSRWSMAEMIADIFLRFLRQRFQLDLVEPTAPELADHLHAAGVPAPLTVSVLTFWQYCSALRFGQGNERGEEELFQEVQHLIRKLDALP